MYEQTHHFVAYLKSWDDPAALRMLEHAILPNSLSFSAACLGEARDVPVPLPRGWPKRLVPPVDTAMAKHETFGGQNGA